MRRFVLALTSFALAACSWSLSGYSNGEDNVPAAGDAANDTVTGDATSDRDAGEGSDATLPDGGRRPCRDRPLSATLLFCDDFDDVGEKVGAKWTGSGIGTVGAAKTALSPPNALLSSVPMLTTQYGFSRVAEPLKIPPAKSYTYRFSLAVEALGGMNGGYLGLAALLFTPSTCKTQGSQMLRYVSLTASGEGQLYLFAVGMGTECWTDPVKDDTAATFSQAHIASAQPPVWRDIALRVATESCPGATSGSSVTLSVDGQRVVCAQLGIDPMQKTEGASVELGTDNGAPWGDVALDYDDVEVTTE